MSGEQPVKQQSWCEHCLGILNDAELSSGWPAKGERPDYRPRTVEAALRDAPRRRTGSPPHCVYLPWTWLERAQVA